MFIPRLALASLVLTTLLPACSKSAPPAAQTTTSAVASAPAAPSAAPGTPDAVKAELSTLVAECRWMPEGIGYCEPLNALTKKLGPSGETRSATLRECFALLADTVLGKAAATCVATYAEKSQVEQILGALEKTTDDPARVELAAVRVELARGVDRLRAEQGAPAARVIRLVRTLAPRSDDRPIVNHLLSSLIPEDEKKDVTPEAFALALEIYNAPDREPLHRSASNVLGAAPSRRPELCKLFASTVETSKSEWLAVAGYLANHKGCEADFARVFPTFVKKITSSNEGKGLTSVSDLDALLLLDAQTPLSAAQKKSLVTAVDSLTAHAETDAEKREIQLIHAHYTR